MYFPNTLDEALEIYPNARKDVYHRIDVRNKTNKDLEDVLVSLDIMQGQSGSLLETNFDQITGGEYNYNADDPAFTIPKLSKGNTVSIHFHNMVNTSWQQDSMHIKATIDSSDPDVDGVDNSANVYYAVTQGEKIEEPTPKPEEPEEPKHELPQTGSPLATITLLFAFVGLMYAAFRLRLAHIS